MSNSVYVTNYRQRIKQKAVLYKGSKCCICGYNKCITALEFHHVNPEEKDFSLSGDNSTRSWEKVKPEIDKCILVCSNCHREIHQNMYDQNHFKSLLDIKDENALNIYIEEHDNSIKEKICPICNKSFKPESNSKGKYCSHECAYKAQQKTNKPSKEELKDLIIKKPFTEIGRMYNVSDNTIRKWCKSYELPYYKKYLNITDI